MTARAWGLQVSLAAVFDRWRHAVRARLRWAVTHLASALPGRRRTIELVLIGLAVFALVAFVLVLGTESYHRR